MDFMPLGRYLPGVLIVDDEALVRSFLRIALKAMVRVVEAEDGERALEILQEPGRASVDLVMVDYVLPRLSGLDVLQATKRSWPWIPVVLMTGFGSEDLAVKALRAGARDYLKKPIALDALLKTVAALTTAGAESAPFGATISGDGGTRALHPNIGRALAFMREHFAEAITLTDVAQAARLSRFHFCRLFHTQTGVPFHDYLHELRVNRAKALLADRYMTITEVAYAVGFNDLSHFDRTFRRIVGRSPTEYRTSMRCA